MNRISTIHFHQRKSSPWGAVGVGLLSMAVFLSTTPAHAQDAYEPLPTLKASDFVSKDLLKGEHHTVLEDVSNDGYLNTYTINTTFGQMSTTSTASVPNRINEINAIAAMEETKNTEAFQEAAKKAATGAFQGARSLVTSPVETLGGAVSGVGRMFRRAAESAERSKSDAEDSAFKSMIGFSSAKRDVAAQFHVDVYSSNQRLQEELNELAWTQFAGDLTIKAPMAFVPGGAGLVVTTSQTITALNELIATTPPQDLRIKNREKLQAMGIDEDLVDLFVGNGVFTPRQQTVIVSALEAMPNTANRALFVKFAINTDSPDLAFFRQRSATMYAAYSQHVEQITEFVALGHFVAGRTESGTLIMQVPVDFLVWTRSTAGTVSELDRHIAAMSGVKAKQLWLDRASPTSKKQLQVRGWTFHEKSEEFLMSKIK